MRVALDPLGQSGGDQLTEFVVDALRYGDDAAANRSTARLTSARKLSVRKVRSGMQIICGPSSGNFFGVRRRPPESRRDGP